MLLKEFFIRILNWFPHRVKSGGSSGFTSLVVMCIVGVCLALCFAMALSIEPKLAFFIDSYELPARDGITVGENSDICFKGVPHDYITLSAQDDGSFRWSVNDANADSLMYFKINDVNPQKHAIRDDGHQVLRVVLPGMVSGQADTLALTGEEIWDEWNGGFRKQRNVLLRHFAARYGVMHRSEDEADSMKWLSYCNQRRVRSFLERSGSGISLVILDDNTSLADGDSLISYARTGVTEAGGENGGRCKVQFFSVSDHCYMNGGTGNGTFRISGVNYVMKPNVILTDWGAGHAMVLADAQDGGCRVTFPKAAGFVGTLDSLYASCGNTSHVFTFKQKGHSFPTGTDIYLPQMSRSLSQDICVVKMNGTRDVVIRDNNNDSVSVGRAEGGMLPFSVVPSINRVTLHSGDARINCRAGYVDTVFALSYVIVPLAVALVLVFLVLCRWSPVRVNVDDSCQPFYCTDQLRGYPLYFSMLILIAFAYSVCKSLIALKLSYTYPYFEKLTAVTPVAASLFILVFFTAAMVLNVGLTWSMEGDRDMYGYNEDTNRGRRKWVAWTVVTALFAALVFVLFRLQDNLVSGAVIESYFPSQIYNLNVLRWRESFGINDTHRSIPYTLMLVEAMLLVVWLVENMVCQFCPQEILDMHRERIGKCVEGCGNRLRSACREAYLCCRERMSQLCGRIPASQSERVTTVFAQAYKCYATVRNLTRRYYSSTLAVLMALLLVAYFFPGMTKPCLVLVLLLMAVYVWDAVVLAVKSLFPWHFITLAALAFIGPMLGNFGTAFITLAVIIGLCNALTGVSFDKAKDRTDDGEHRLETRHVVFFQMIVISAIYIVCAMAADNGYMTNYIGFILAVMCIYFIMDKNGEYVSEDAVDAERESRWVGLLLSFAIVLLVVLPTLCSRVYNANEVNYDRMSRRINLYSNFNETQRSGFRYAESDAEFMVIMSHYMQMKDAGDPLANETHFLHPSVSTGQSPVVLNDLSVPVAFFGSYGVLRTSCVYFLLIFALLLLVTQFSLSYESSSGYVSYLTNAMQWRLLAVFMWVGTSFYIYLSYIDWLPFAGRLNPGFGVDAVGEALESAILLAFMACITVKRDES